MVRPARDRDDPPPRAQGAVLEGGVTVPDELATGLGAVLRRRREVLRMGQEQLAATLGVRQQTVSRWERGLAVPRPRRVVELARLLELEPAALHRLAGYLPPAEPSAWDDLRARLPQLSRAELVLLAEHAWEELRSRDGLDPDGGPQAEAATG